jgi:helicase SWR1
MDRALEDGRERDDDNQERVNKLHTLLRPYLLRRMKADVEKELPAKYEHLVYCRLSKRQRFLYDEFMARSETKEILASGNFLSKRDPELFLYFTPLMSRQAWLTA